MAAVWPATAVEDSNLNMQIAALRRVLDEGRAERQLHPDHPGRGYRFAIPLTRVEPAASAHVVVAPAAVDCRAAVRQSQQ